MKSVWKEVFYMSSDCEGRTQEDIGKDIEEWRARAGLTQLQLALIIGLKNDRQYRRICCDCDYEFPRKSLRLLAKLMKVTVDFLTPDAEFDEDPEYIDSIIEKGSSFSQEEIEKIVIEKTHTNLSDFENRIVGYTTEIINLEDEEAKEDFADQIGISLKIAKRGIPKSKVS